MEKPLRVLVQIDTRNSAASIEVRGALTGASCETLLNILQHTAKLGADICVNLTRTVRIEAAALEVLAGVADDVERSAPANLQMRVHIQLPPDALPGHPTAGSLPPGSREALDNDTALAMILRRNTRVLAGPYEPGPGDAAIPDGTAPRWRVLPGRRS
ncbi:hypothetical protein [Arthrobacter sp. zg-Y1110]|uniref:hypothetical protein n=1 Tax=Arthrobacter sp. zg-Y1110 TaxID=2886932 RepID=UPI001D152F2E|nr:hypothetical protein [Arthrobacter sp. zg-Y1110]MCC3289421.1 hypothetical protein [Arthrobacter sp. zg-Y1110]UWX85134.1 hypothetical protein N2K99_00710 [Arthrobacter sp. zg-Y1110]